MLPSLHNLNRIQTTRNTIFAPTFDNRILFIMNIIEIAHEVIREAGGFLGSASVGATGYFYKRFTDTEIKASSALTIARTATDSIIKLDRQFSEFQVDYDSFRRTSENKISNRITDASRDRNEMGTLRSEVDKLAIQQSENSKKIEELKGEILRERGARHALQKEFGNYIRGEAESWRELHRSLGQIEGRLETALSTMK